MTNEDRNSTARKLIVAAFQAARATGKTDWYRMTTAVLKNRMLQLSDNRFREADFGCQTFAEFVLLFPDLLRIDRFSRPAVVELLEPSKLAPSPVAHNGELAPATSPAKSEGEVAAHEFPPGTQIRPDLWQAVMDYSSGHKFVWDPAKKAPVQSDESKAGPLLPTIDADLLKTWRSDFAAKHEPELTGNPSAIERLRRWQEQGLGTKVLPFALQREWNIYQKANVLRRLHAWFNEHSIPPPTDLLKQLVLPSTISPAVLSKAEVPAEMLRQLILECVRAMTAEELSELRLPPTALLRARMSGQK